MQKRAKLTVLVALGVASLVATCAAPRKSARAPEPAFAELNYPDGVRFCRTATEINLDNAKTRGIEALFFVIDTSASMRGRDPSLRLEIAEAVQQLLLQHPDLKTAQFIDASGANMARAQARDGVSGEQIHIPPFLGIEPKPDDLRKMIGAGEFVDRFRSYRFQSHGDPSRGLAKALAAAAGAQSAHIIVIGDAIDSATATPELVALGVAVEKRGDGIVISAVEINPRPRTPSEKRFTAANQRFRDVMKRIVAGTGGSYFSL